MSQFFLLPLSLNGENETVEYRQYVLRNNARYNSNEQLLVSFSSLRETLGEMRQLQFDICWNTSPPLPGYEVLNGCHNWISFLGNQLVGDTQCQCQWPKIWINRGRCPSWVFFFLLWLNDVRMSSNYEAVNNNLYQMFTRVSRSPTLERKINHSKWKIVLGQK